MSAGLVEVEIIPDERPGWVALVYEGEVVRRVRDNMWADYFALTTEANIRKRLAQRRHCLCCGRIIASEGPHHRLCNGCRRAA